MTYLDQEIGKNNYNVGDVTDIADPTYEQILETLKGLMTEEERRDYWSEIEEIVKESTYAGVLYEQYRSPLVHEALMRGHWYGVATDLPVYVAPEGGEVALTFPPAFLVDILQDVLNTIFLKYWVTTE